MADKLVKYASRLLVDDSLRSKMLFRTSLSCLSWYEEPPFFVDDPYEPDDRMDNCSKDVVFSELLWDGYIDGFRVMEATVSINKIDSTTVKKYVVLYEELTCDFFYIPKKTLNMIL